MICSACGLNARNRKGIMGLLQAGLALLHQRLARPMDIGGFLWLIIDVSFVAALAAGMIYGIHEWRRRRRSRVTEEVEKQAVDRAYRD
jgi:hypothetical protein